MIILLDKKKEAKQIFSLIEKITKKKFFLFKFCFFNILLFYFLKIFFPAKKIFLMVVNEKGFNLVFRWRFLLEKILKEGKIIYNFDIEKPFREISKKISCLGFGFKDGANFQIIDLRWHDEKINFKINYENKIIPFWLEKIEKDDFSNLYCFLGSVCLAVLTGSNLVEISQLFKDFKIK